MHKNSCTEILLSVIMQQREGERQRQKEKGRETKYTNKYSFSEYFVGF